MLNLYHNRLLTRRDWLRRCGSGLGLVGLAALLAEEGMLDSPACAAANPMAPHAGHFPARAKSIIWLFINGGPSHVDTWEHKPALAKYDGTEFKGLDPETGFFKNAVGPLMKWDPLESTCRHASLSIL